MSLLLLKVNETKRKVIERVDRRPANCSQCLENGGSLEGLVGGRERAHERGVSKNIFDAKGPGQELDRNQKRQVPLVRYTIHTVVLL